MKQFMQEAIKESKKPLRKNEGGPFGAVIVRDGKIIARGHNQVLSTNDPTEHAEIDAIRKATRKLKKHDLSDCEIYTSCEPCPMCLSAIHWARIKKIYYGCTRDDAKSIGFDDELLYEILRGKRRGTPKKQLMRKESLEIFSEWKDKKDKELY